MLEESAEVHHNGNTLHVLSDRNPLRIILTYLGCFLLLRGNTLPWPCLPAQQSSPYCFPLNIFDTSAVQITAFLVIGLLLITLAVNLLRSPYDIVSWFILLLVPNLLFVAKLRHDPFWGDTPLVYINQDLGGPSIIIMPVSLIVAWLTLRPRALLKKWRLLTIIAISALLSLTVYFLVLMGNRPYQVTVSAFIEQQGILSTGPLLILAGGILLLGAEYVGIKRDRKQTVGHEKVSGATAINPHRLVNAGFWSALLAAASPIILIGISFLGDYSPVMGQTDRGVYLLVSALTICVILVQPISFVVLIASLYFYAPAEKKTWVLTGFVFSVAYALVYVFSNFLQDRILSTFTQLYERVATSFPILLRYGALGTLSLVFASLALLFTLPVFHNRRGIELVIRWCIIIISVLIIASGLGYLLTSARIPTLSVLANLVGQFVVFPVIMVLIAIVFKRVEKVDALTGAEST